MVANYDRVLEEIRKEAQELASTEVSSDELAKLAMEIVDVEDRHRLRPREVNKEVSDLLLNQVNRTERDTE